MQSFLTNCRHCGDEIEIDVALPKGVTCDRIDADADCRPCSEAHRIEDEMSTRADAFDD